MFSLCSGRDLCNSLFTVRFLLEYCKYLRMYLNIVNYFYSGKRKYVWGKVILEKVSKGREKR